MAHILIRCDSELSGSYCNDGS